MTDAEIFAYDHALTEAMDVLDEYLKTRSADSTPAFELGVMAARNMVRRLMDFPPPAEESAADYWKRIRNIPASMVPEYD